MKRLALIFILLFIPCILLANQNSKISTPHLDKELAQKPGQDTSPSTNIPAAANSPGENTTNSNANKTSKNKELNKELKDGKWSIYINGKANTAAGSSETVSGSGGLGLKFNGKKYNFIFSISFGSAGVINGTSSIDFAHSIIYPSSGLPSIVIDFDGFGIIGNLGGEKQYKFGWFGKIIISANEWELDTTSTKNGLTTISLDTGPEISYKYSLVHFGIKPAFVVRFLDGPAIKDKSFMNSTLRADESFYYGMLLNFFIDYNEQRFFFNVSYFDTNQHVTGLSELKIFAGVEVLGKLTSL